MHAPDASSYADLMYQPQFILELTPSYLREIAAAPGGWTRLAVTLLIYACGFPFPGALAVTAVALFFFWIFSRYLQEIGGRRPLLLRYVPVFFILAICAWYELSYCAFLLPVAGALAFAVFYRRFTHAATAAGVLWFTALFWAAWYLMHWGSLLVLLLILIPCSFGKERRIHVIAAAVCNAALLWVADAFFLPLKMTIRWSDFTMMSGLPLAVTGFFPLAAIVRAALLRIRPQPEGGPKAAGAILRMSLLACGTVAFAVWLYREPVNRDTRTVARTVHHVIKGQWDAILHEKTAPLFANFPHKSGILQVLMMHAVNHALFRTGQLGDRMFTFPQAVFSYDPLLMLQSMFVHSYVNWIVVLDLTMELGMVNTAEKIAGEIMENMGPFPDIIHRRALVQIAKGNREAAAVFLNRLARMPFQRKEAKRLLGILHDDAALFSEPRIASMAANRDTVDYFLDSKLDCSILFRYLLQSNPRNRAAFDYLMSSCLLYDRLDEAAALAPAAPAFGYAVLPRHWEEAICLHQSVKLLQSSSELSFSGLRQETIERFFAFTRAWMRLKDDSGAAAKLAPAFGDSYYFFSIFRYSAGAPHE